MNEHKMAFLKLFKTIAYNKNRHEVFRDFVHMAAISLHNSVAMNRSLEAEYMDIVKGYEKEDAVKFSHLLSHVVMALENKTCDFLGSVFMELELGNNHNGQYFTPYDVSMLMAKMAGLPKEIDYLEEDDIWTVMDPACGSGSTLIAYTEMLLEIGVNPQRMIWVHCTDIDSVASMMCYIHLSLLNIPAEVVTGDSLALTHSRVMRTPAHYLGGWDNKLEEYWKKEQEETEVDNTVKEETKPINECLEQLDMFDLVV